MLAIAHSRAKVFPSQKLLTALQPYDRIAIVTHDNPDPDAIASGWAILFLIDRKLGTPTRLIGGGAIVRAENRHMVQLLESPIELVDEFQPDESTAIVLVDCSPEASNHLICRKPAEILGVIDHHENDSTQKLPFRDIRSHVAASATIAASYLREQLLVPGTRLASALVYAIRTETMGSETQYSDLDRSVLPWLTERADPSLLAEIENAPLRREYFRDLVLGVQTAMVYGDASLCLLPRAEGPEIVGEVADLLIRCQDIRRVLCGAVFGNDLLLSVRTARHSGNATQLLHETIRGLGRGGGHKHRAGGKLVAVARDGRLPDALREDLRRRWLAACAVDQQQPAVRLVPRSEIIEHL